MNPNDEPSASDLPAPFNDPKPLTDGVVTLYPLGPEFDQVIFEAIVESIPELEPFMSFAHEGYQIEETREFLARGPANRANDDSFGFGIFDSVSGQYLGNVGCNGLDRKNQRANLGYWIRTSATGRGIATRATILCARFGIEELGLVRIEILASVENPASIRVAEKAGAHREGVLRSRIVLHDRAHDAVLFSLVRGDAAIAGRPSTTDPPASQ